MHRPPGRDAHLEGTEVGRLNGSVASAGGAVDLDREKLLERLPGILLGKMLSTGLEDEPHAAVEDRLDERLLPSAGKIGERHIAEEDDVVAGPRLDVVGHPGESFRGNTAAGCRGLHRAGDDERRLEAGVAADTGIEEPQIPARRGIDDEDLCLPRRHIDRELEGVVFRRPLLRLRGDADRKEARSLLRRMPGEDRLLAAVPENELDGGSHGVVVDELHLHTAAGQAAGLDGGDDRDGVVEGHFRGGEDVGDGDVGRGLRRTDRDRDHRRPRLPAGGLGRAADRIERIDADGRTAVGDEDDPAKDTVGGVVEGHRDPLPESRVGPAARGILRRRIAAAGL